METKLGSRFSLPAWAFWSLLALALAGTFGHNFAEMWVRWFPAWSDAKATFYNRITGGESYYTHAPLVPIVSLMIALLVIRHTRIPVEPRPVSGGLISGWFILVHLLGCLARVNFVCGFAMIGLLGGLIVMVWGWTALRRLWFALAMLAFMVPLPEVSIATLNFRLKLMAADWGVRGAEMLGIIVARPGDGNMVKIWDPAGPAKELVIANVCNGLRTLISLIAFGALYAYVCRLTGFWRIALFILSVPIAVVANALRIVSLIAVADIWNSKVATGWYHDTSGVLVFVLAFMFMFGIEKAVLSIRKWVGRPAKILPLFAGVQRTDQDEGQWGRMVAAGSRRGSLLALALVVFTAAGSWHLNRVTPGFTSGNLAGLVPAELKFAGAAWESTELTMDPQTLQILEEPLYFYRSYVTASQPKADLCVIFSRDNRKGTHPPDLCVQGGGNDIVAADTVYLDNVAKHGKLACRELVVRSGPHSMYFLYTYKCGGEYTPSFWRQQAKILFNGLLSRNASGALVRVTTPVRPLEGADGLQEARQRAMDLMATAIPHLDAALP